jgi:hypothetical protein
VFGGTSRFAGSKEVRERNRVSAKVHRTGILNRGYC